jgi:hypothetical protein
MFVAPAAAVPGSRAARSPQAVGPGVAGAHTMVLLGLSSDPRHGLGPVIVPSFWMSSAVFSKQVAGMSPCAPLVLS